MEIWWIHNPILHLEGVTLRCFLAGLPDFCRGVVLQLPSMVVCSVKHPLQISSLLCSTSSFPWLYPGIPFQMKYLYSHPCFGLDGDYISGVSSLAVLPILLHVISHPFPPHVVSLAGESGILYDSSGLPWMRR